MYISAAVKDILDENQNVRAQVAHDPNTRPSVLESLINDQDTYIRGLVAANPSCPLHLLEQLANDPQFHVRQAIVNNPNVPEELLNELYNDPDCAVRLSAAYKLGRISEFIHTMPHYGMDIDYDVAGNFDYEEWMYHACDGGPGEFEENAVVLSYNTSLNSTSPSWWEDTMVLLNQINFDCDNIDQFLEVNGEYADEDELVHLYYVWQDCKPLSININANAVTQDAIIWQYKAVQALNPDLDLCMTRMCQYNRPDRWAICIWDCDGMELYEDEMRDWFFGDICEICTYRITDEQLEGIKPEKFEYLELWDLFRDYGDSLDDFTTLTGTQMRELKKGNFVENLARFMGNPVGDCILL